MSNSIGITFDFFNTLVELDEDVPTISQFLSNKGYHCDPLVEKIWNSNGFDGEFTNDPKVLSYDDWRYSSLSNLCNLCGVPKNQVSTTVEELLILDKSWTVKGIEDSIKTLEQLVANDFKFCILSNWDYPLAAYIRAANLPRNVKAITSAQVGFRKPHPEIFASARRALGVAPQHHIHVGDSWYSDVTGAVRSGAWAVWVLDKASQKLCHPPKRIKTTNFANLSHTVISLAREIS